MRPTDQDPWPRATDVDHCAVHQFIRLHGRRPTPEELAQGLIGSGHTEGPAATSARAPRPSALRREVARLIHRL
jgi:hypothetical protein